MSDDEKTIRDRRRWEEHQATKRFLASQPSETEAAEPSRIPLPVRPCPHREPGSQR